MNTDPTAITLLVARYFAIAGIGVPIVWVITEVFARATGAKALAVALVIGPLYGLFFLAYGWLPILPVVWPDIEVAVNLLWAALTGIAVAFGSKGLNDSLMKKLGWKIPARQ